ncbi:MAG: ABC transporter substrate-binding protein [Clostridiales bacterium]|nr:ABC transporter substrate-binding protein [Clostridiales bacterium]
MKKYLSLLLVVLLVATSSLCTAESGAQDFHVAVSLPFTGDNATYAEYIQRGIEIGLMHLEEDGGLYGKGGKIIIDYFDDRNDAKEGTNIAERIVSDDSYLLEIGSFSSSVSLPCASIYNEAEVPQYALTCSHADFLGQTEWGFSLSMTQDVAAARVATWDVLYLKKNNIALLYSQDEWGNQCKTYYEAQVDRLDGNICSVESFEKNTTDYTAVLTKLKQLKPDLVMCFCAENDIVLIMNQAETVGLETEFQVSSKSRTSNVLSELGAKAEGLYGVYATDKDMTNPVYKRYYDTYIGLYPEEKSTQKYADQGYNCIMTVVWAIENGGTTRESFRDVLATLNNFVGVQGPITFAAGRKVLQEQFLSVVKDGEWINFSTEEIGFHVDDYLVLE